jgi:hypothetical protein
MRSKTKASDALAESRKWRERLSRKIAGMPPAQELAYFNRPRDVAATAKKHWLAPYN